MKKVYPDTYYMEVWEKFTRADGEPSYYTMMWGNGYTKQYLFDDYRIVTKEKIKEKVDEFLRDTHYAIDSFKCTENEYGWTYERYVRYHDDESNEHDVVEKGQHTDHEEYTVAISFIHEDIDIMSKLKCRESLTTAQRLVNHLDENAEDYYKNITDKSK